MLFKSDEEQADLDMEKSTLISYSPSIKGELRSRRSSNLSREPCWRQGHIRHNHEVHRKRPYLNLLRHQEGGRASRTKTSGTVDHEQQQAGDN